MSSERPVRVLYVSPGGMLGRGGMGRMARYILASFRARPADVDCQVIDSYGPGAAALMPIYFLAASVRIIAACLTNRVDVVHLHMAQRGSSLRKLALLNVVALCRVPVVLHLHGSQFEAFSNGLSRHSRHLMISTMQRAAAIIVIGTYWRHYLVESLQIRPEQIRVVPNGVPIPPLVPKQDTSNTPLIVTLGLLGKRKGTFDLMTALASKSLAQLEWKAVIAGNGDLEGVKRAAFGLKLAARVEFPGWLEVKAASDLLRTAAIFVLPSHNEGLPVAVLEAMAMQLPIVATPVGAIPDAIISGETGLLVPVGNPEALATAIERLLLDPTLRDQLGRSAHEKFLAQFNIEATAEQLIKIYREASSQRRRVSVRRSQAAQ